MPSQSSIVLLSLLASAAVHTPLTAAAETVLGAYIFARHGDRTAKSNPPVELTELGYSQTFSTGAYYRRRYVADDAPAHIRGISPHVVVPAQVAASAPSDAVLQKSAVAFFQGLYPPVGSGNATRATLRDGTVVEPPMDGYQLVFIDQPESRGGSSSSSGKNSENAAWLQGTSDCHNAKVSSDSYFESTPYRELLESTAAFYESLSPVLQDTFAPEDLSYRNAYLIFDALNVASIHNASFPLEGDDDDDDNNNTLAQLQLLANTFEYNLAFNASDPIRAYAGSTLATDILTALTALVDSRGTDGAKLSVQFGPYATFLAFFGLAKLPQASVDFTGIPDYASTMVFELLSSADGDDGVDPGFPPHPDDLRVRFLFHNGTLGGSTASGRSDGDADALVAYPLFGQSETVLPWPDFVRHMQDIGIPTDRREWCKMCGSTTGECAAIDAASDHDGGSISSPVAGLIGALVTLAVILGVQALVLVAGGFRLVRKSSVARNVVEVEKNLSFSSR
ncbi:hypothetical protein VTO42DRAFT_5295 [Malbranchea cinnamomea]